MTLILELERKLIFYRPGILRYAMRQAGMQLGAAQNGAKRRELLSQSLKRGWDVARAELAALQRLQALVQHERDGRLRNHIIAWDISSPNEAVPTALTARRLQ